MLELHVALVQQTNEYQIQSRNLMIRTRAAVQIQLEPALVVTSICVFRSALLERLQTLSQHQCLQVLAQHGVSAL